MVRQGVVIVESYFLRARLHRRTLRSGASAGRYAVDPIVGRTGLGRTGDNLPVALDRRFHGQDLVWQQYIFLRVRGCTDRCIFGLAV